MRRYADHMRTRLIVLPMMVLVVASYLWWTQEPAQHGPAATWRIGTGTDVSQGHNFDDLPAESLVRLSLHGTEPLHVYVFSHSREDGTLLMFPSPAVDADLANPLPAGNNVLPGKREGEEVAWTTRTGILALTTYVAIAAREPIAALEELAPQLRRWTNTAMPDHAMAVTLPQQGADFAGKARQPLPSELLLEAAEIANQIANPNGPMQAAKGRAGVWLSAWKVRERRQPKPNGK